MFAVDLMPRPMAGVPAWVADEVRADMAIDDLILRCAAFAGFPTTHGFCAEGSAFFVSVREEDVAFVYVVSCTHVVRPFRDKRTREPNADSIWIRSHYGAGPPSLFKTRRSDWTCHPDYKNVDICVHGFNVAENIEPRHIASINSSTNFLTPTLEEKYGPRLGDEIFITGAFVGRVGEARNIPVVRIANIAAMPIEPIWGASPKHPAYLIESRSIGGISGSPAFLNIDPDYERGPGEIAENESFALPYILVGVVQGFHSGQYPEDVIPQNAANNEEDNVVAADVDFNAGICVMLPVARVVETLNQEILKKDRMVDIENRRKRSGYRPASARAATLESDDNPNHREDFIRLVDVAARKRPQGDQT
jgi:hypothetical protein